MSTELKVIKMNNNDNVGTSLKNIKQGEVFNVLSKEGQILDSYQALNKIPFANKVALTDIDVDSNIIKYGYSIGKAYKDIKKGEMVHIHNIMSNRIKLPDHRRKVMIDELQI